MEHQMFTVKGMTCQNCVEKITALLSADPKINRLQVTLNPPRIHFNSTEKYDAERMNRVLSPLGKYSVSDKDQAEPMVFSRYLPLFLLFGLTAGVPALNMLIHGSSTEQWMCQFMGATLIALSYFKLLDLPKFSEAFSTYDPVAVRRPAYGYVYPFFELTAGVGLVLAVEVKPLSLFTILFLFPTTVGVINALRAKRKFQCACLGTAFNLPLTQVTIVENVLMMTMSAMIVFEIA